MYVQICRFLRTTQTKKIMYFNVLSVHPATWRHREHHFLAHVTKIKWMQIYHEGLTSMWTTPYHWLYIAAKVIVSEQLLRTIFIFKLKLLYKDVTSILSDSAAISTSCVVFFCVFYFFLFGFFFFFVFSGFFYSSDRPHIFALYWSVSVLLRR